MLYSRGSHPVPAGLCFVVSLAATSRPGEGSEEIGSAGAVETNRLGQSRGGSARQGPLQETKALLGLHGLSMETFDLIVIGSHGYGAIDRVLGTTAAKVVNHADRTVLVVREKPGS